MTFEDFKKQLKTSGFGRSDRETAKLLAIFTEELDAIRKKNGRILIPNLGVFKTVTKPAKIGVMIAGRPLNIQARQRFVFKPLAKTSRPPN